MPVVNLSPDYTSGGYAGDPVPSIGGGYDPNASASTAQATSAQTAPDWNVGGWANNTGGGTTSQGTPGGYDSESARNNISGLMSGGGAEPDSRPPPPVTFSGGDDSDWRVRISLAAKASIFYKDNSNELMRPLRQTNGVIFPYTPQLSVTHSATYNTTQLTHSNYNMQFYQGSEVQDITITGDFTVQNVLEGRYLLAAIYFFRAATKMFFGKGVDAGQPPPLVFLSGYGTHYLPQVPCVISSFQHNMPQDVDYINVAGEDTVQDVTTQSATVAKINEASQFYNDNNIPLALRSASIDSNALAHKQQQFVRSTVSTWLPTSSSISVTLKPVYSRSNLYNNFDLNKFAKGELLQNNKTGYGGFI